MMILHLPDHPAALNMDMTMMMINLLSFKFNMRVTTSSLTRFRGVSTLVQIVYKCPHTQVGVGDLFSFNDLIFYLLLNVLHVSVLNCLTLLGVTSLPPLLQAPGEWVGERENSHTIVQTFTFVQWRPSYLIIFNTWVPTMSDVVCAVLSAILLSSEYIFECKYFI